jgi:hypothetical protein
MRTHTPGETSVGPQALGWRLRMSWSFCMFIGSATPENGTIGAECTARPPKGFPEAGAGAAGAAGAGALGCPPFIFVTIWA